MQRHRFGLEGTLPEIYNENIQQLKKIINQITMEEHL